MIRAVCAALSLLFAVAALACVDESVTPASPPAPPSAPAPAPALVSAPSLPVAERDPSEAAVDPAPAARERSLLEQEAVATVDGDLVDHKVEGLRLLANGDAAAAIAELKKALAVDSSADVWAALGDAYLQSGDVARGVGCLDEAVAVDVDHKAARRMLTRHFLSAQNGARARHHAEEWVRLAPQQADARQALGRAYAQLGMWKEAIDEFVLVTDVQPDNVYAWNNLGFAALQLGDNERAAHALERVLSRKPQQGFMLNNLGVAYERLGRTAEAHAAFARAAELSPKYAQAAQNRDRVQRGMNQAQRIVSNDTLLKLREGEFDVVAPLGGADDDADRLFVPAAPSVDGE